VEDIEGQLRNTIVGRMSDTFAESQVPFLDMAANQIELGQRIAEHLRPAFSELGLTLDSFVVENLSLPEELQKRLDQRIGMNMLGDMQKYTQLQVADSLPIAAANEGGGLAGAGVGLGAGFTMAQQMMNAMRPDQSGGPAPQNPVPPAPPSGPTPPAPPAASSEPQPAGEVKFCVECGKSIAKRAKFCPECGTQQ
jgi:membrane protease subunit (stomatin/prohibitin family)